MPQGGVFPRDPQSNFSYPLKWAGYHFNYTEDPFDFRISNNFGNSTLFSTYEGELIYSDHYLQISTELDCDYTYGLGERFNQNLRLKEGKWTIFNRDRG